jgi:GT2 family glycosyltransferase
VISGGWEYRVDISVIIACHNGAGTLGEALDSLTRQQCGRPWEIVLADNGSTDASAEIFEAHAARHPEIPMRRVDASAIRGKSYALNRAIRAARGRSVVFCDADDTVAPGWLAAMAAALDERDFVAARMDLTALNAPWLSMSRENIQADGVPRLPHAPHCAHAGGATLGFHRRVFEAVGGFDPAFLYLEDTEFCIRAALAGYSLGFVPEAVYNYRLRETPEQNYRQAYSYARYRTLLRQRYGGEKRFPVRQVLGHSARLGRLLGARLGATLLERGRSPLERARAARELGRTAGTLSATLWPGPMRRGRAAPPPLGAAAAVNSGRQT